MVQEKAHYTMMQRGTPTSGRPVKNCPVSAKKPVVGPFFCYPESDAISPQPMMGWLVIILTKRGGAA